MGKIIVRLAGRQLFEWFGGRREIRDISRRVERAAKSVGKTTTELSGLTMQSVFSTSGLSLDEAIRDMQIGGLIHYVLNMPSDESGKSNHGDYLAAGADLIFDLHLERAGKVRIEVTKPPPT